MALSTILFRERVWCQTRLRLIVIRKGMDRNTARDRSAEFWHQTGLALPRPNQYPSGPDVKEKRLD